MRIASTGRLASTLLCASILLARSAWGCDIPVHLWALERWTPDPYPVIVFHDGALPPSQHESLGRLKAGADHANLIVSDVDVTALDEFARAVWEAQSDAVLPWIVLRHPMAVPAAVQLWSGPLDNATVDALVNSPLRREIGQHLVEADAVVWVLLDGDDVTAMALDDALDAVLENPPVAAPTPGAPTPTRVFPMPRFPVVRVNRADPKEHVFVQMLLGVEPGLSDYAEPMAFPVFGRGRALYALVGAGINPQTVRKACAFLVNGCSCQVKEDNPGMDLLLAVDWDAHLGDIQTGDDPHVPPLPGVPAQAAIADSRPSAPVAAPSAFLRNLAAALALGVFAVAAASVVLWKQRGERFQG